MREAASLRAVWVILAFHQCGKTRHYCEPRMKHALEEIDKIGLMKILGFSYILLYNLPQSFISHLWRQLVFNTCNKKIVTPYGKNKDST
jgi:hypothetical protein